MRFHPAPSGFNSPATTGSYTLSLHDALPIWSRRLDDAQSRLLVRRGLGPRRYRAQRPNGVFREGLSRSLLDFLERSEEHTSELQSRRDLVCRLLLEKKKYRLTSS